MSAASPPVAIIDAHTHVWCLADTPQPWITPAQAPAIARDFSLADLRRAAVGTGVTAALLVQSANDLPETRALLGLAAGDPFVAGVVGWVDLARDDAVAALEDLRRADAGRWLRGVRHVFAPGEAAGWLSASAVARSLDLLGTLELSFDLLLSTGEMELALAVARRHPDTIFVLDHLAKPPVRNESLWPWRRRLRALVDLPNVYTKISGLPGEADWEHWTAGTLTPYLEVALEVFGPRRLIFATDWPVCTVAGSYAQVVDAQLGFVAGLSPDERRLVLSENASRAYRLTGPDPRHVGSVGPGDVDPAPALEAHADA
jgi:L-fuconolactonase